MTAVNCIRHDADGMFCNAAVATQTADRDYSG